MDLDLGNSMIWMINTLSNILEKTTKTSKYIQKSKTQDTTDPDMKITKKQVKRRVTRVSDSLGQTSLMGAKP